MPTPQFCHEIVKDEHGAEPKHNVWVIIGKTKFGLPVTFSSLSQGQEKVAKKVLDQLRQNKADGKTASKSSCFVGALRVAQVCRLLGILLSSSSLC